MRKAVKKLEEGNYGLCCLHCLVLLRKSLEEKGGIAGTVLTRDYDTKEMDRC